MLLDRGRAGLRAGVVGFLSEGVLREVESWLASTEGRLASALLYENRAYEAVSTLATETGGWRRRHAAKFLQRWLHKTLAAAVGRWAQHVRMRAARSQQLRAAVMRLSSRAVDQSLRTWKATVKEGKQLRHKARKTVMRLTSRAVDQSFCTWKATVEEGKQLRHKARKTVLKLVQGRLALAFERWRGWGAEARQLRASARRVLVRLRGRALMVGYERWRVRAAEERQLRTSAQRVVARMTNRVMAATFGTWHEATLQVIHARALDGSVGEGGGEGEGGDGCLCDSVDRDRGGEMSEMGLMLEGEITALMLETRTLLDALPSPQVARLACERRVDTKR